VNKADQKTEHADISIKLSKLKENILTYTNITKLSNSLCKLSPGGQLNLTNCSRNSTDTIHAANGIKPGLHSRERDSRKLLLCMANFLQNSSFLWSIKYEIGKD